LYPHKKRDKKKKRRKKRNDLHTAIEILVVIYFSRVRYVLIGTINQKSHIYCCCCVFLSRHSTVLNVIRSLSFFFVSLSLLLYLSHLTRPLFFFLLSFFLCCYCRSSHSHSPGHKFIIITVG